MIELYKAEISLGEDAHALIALAAREICGMDDAKVIRTDLGKPYFESLPIRFSLSHSGCRAILAVSDREIGADIQQMRDVNLRLAERFFTEREQEYVAGDKLRFFEVWTKKEAYGKWRGDGFAAAKNVCVLDLDFFTETDGEYMIAVYEE